MLEQQKHVEHPLIWPKTVEFRLYQNRIADTASQKNMLVILPTALGKTVISAIVAADMLYNYRDAKILVMAPTRPLVMQHRESARASGRCLNCTISDCMGLPKRTPRDIDNPQQPSQPSSYVRFQSSDQNLS